MQKVSNYFAALVFVIFISSISRAGVYFEPYFGYTLGKYKTDFTESTPVVMTGSSNADATGVTYGGKLGYSAALVQVGADYMGSALTILGSSTSTQDWGAFVRVTAFGLVDVAGTYFFSSQLSNSVASSTGNGYKLGVGFSILELLNVNLDYVRNQYSSVNPSPPAIYSSFSGDLTRYVLSVSVPLHF